MVTLALATLLGVPWVRAMVVEDSGAAEEPPCEWAAPDDGRAWSDCAEVR